MAEKRAWGVDTYAKWDQFQDEEDDDGSTAGPSRSQEKMKATQFSLGNETLDIKDISYITPELEETKCARVKKIKQEGAEVWQVVVRKLRVWAASSEGPEDGDDAIPCRPFSVMVNSLYPQGKPLNQQVCSPPQVYPSPQVVFGYVLDTILNPLFGEQRRPKSLTFVDSALAGELYQSFQKLGIEVSHLSESEGVGELNQKFSEMLVRKELASIGPTNERPGILAKPEVSPELVRAVFDTAQRFARAEPWKRIHERKAFEITLTSETQVVVPADGQSVGTKIAPQTFWVSVLGHDAYQHAMQTGQIGGPCGNGAFGVAVFLSKLDLQARLVLEGEELFVDPKEATEERCSFSGQTAEQVGHELKRTKPRKVDIRTGKELMYTDAQALRAHWPTVRKFAIELSELEKGRRERRQHWLGTEFTALFEDKSYLPFDDLDAIDELGLPIVEPNPSLGRCTYPLLLQFGKGEPSRPSAHQLAMLEWAMQGVLTLLEHGHVSKKQFAPNTEITLQPGAAAASSTLLISPASVFFVLEAKAALESRQKQQHEEQQDFARDGLESQNQGDDNDDDDDDDNNKIGGHQQEENDKESSSEQAQSPIESEKCLIQ